MTTHRMVKIGAIAVGVLVLIAGVGLVIMASYLAPDVALGTPSPDVALTTLEGEALPISSLRGKVVLLDFWGST